MSPATPIGSRRVIDVYPARYSPAARPSRQRAAPAKNRSRSAALRISPRAAAAGLPTLRSSRSASASMSASTASASASSISARCPGVVRLQVPNARRAAAAAPSTSDAPAAGTVAMTAPVAGFTTSVVAPSVAATRPPSTCMRSFEDKDIARPLSRPEPVERAVQTVEADALADQLVQQQVAREVAVDERRHVALQDRRAEVAAADALLVDERVGVDRQRGAVAHQADD